MKLKTLMMINNDNNSNFTQNEGSIVSDTEFSLNIVRLLYLLNDEINREIIIELFQNKGSTVSDIEFLLNTIYSLHLLNDEINNKASVKDSVDNNNLYNETVDGNHSSGNDKNIYNNQSTGIENTYIYWLRFYILENPDIVYAYKILVNSIIDPIFIKSDEQK
ncbi:hypothetical protein H8356DRAFT_1336269 [Neocallimastix lanati (nom. inval.)]|nr:hypothetical protein H8356DRAFT_1336269 [Neocallimastix sp. JGI-2020a]